MKKVYLIRHGLPDFPGGRGMCIGTKDIPMGEKGLAQAAEMAKNLPPVILRWWPMEGSSPSLSKN